MNKLKGIDISQWQDSKLDYQEIAKQIDFVILREGYRQQEDKLFYKHICGFRDGAKVPIKGVYHFIYALTEEQARQEALSCVINIERYKLPKDIFIFADFEYDTIEKAKQKGIFLGPTECNNFTRIFCETVEQAGYKAGIYCNIDFYKNYYKKDLLNDYPIWLADYTDIEDYQSMVCMVWQYTDSGKLSGFSENLDMDYWFEDGEGMKEPEDAKIEEIINDATDWMVNLANDDSHGYDQKYRWGEKGDYDCSSAVITAWQQAGVPVKSAGATYTGNMKQAFLACGFKDVTNQVNLQTGEGLIRGDVLLNEVHHTAMYIGDGKEVEASINERGGAVDGQPGDQTGKEVLIRTYRNYPWDCVLRFMPSTEVANQDKKREEIYFGFEEIQKGDECQSVWVLRTILRGRGYKLLNGKLITRSRKFDDNTDYCVRCFQQKFQLEVDGIVGPKTWAKLTGL